MSESYSARVLSPIQIKGPVDPTIVTTIKAAKSQGNVFNVVNQTQFKEQILKADTITFDEMSKLILTGVNFPWVAIVAKTFKFSAPRERTTIHIATTELLNAPKGPTIPKLPTPGKRPKAPMCRNAEDGTNGQTGLKGNKGQDGPPVPGLIVIANKIETQPGAPPIDYIDMRIDILGVDGGDGGLGQAGQDGGDGGDGGNSDWHSPIDYPTDPGCKCGAGSGGNGGKGGNGGEGGEGGNGSQGGTVWLSGMPSAIDILEFAKVLNFGGNRGLGGDPGSNGTGGSGGGRGEHRGGCRGGDDGRGGSPATGLAKKGKDGTAGPRGAIYTWVVDANTLF